MRSISKECKLFKDCPFNYGCLWEIMVVGSAIWSLNVCYDLKALIDRGLVEGPKQPETKIAIGMICTFDRKELVK